MDVQININNIIIMLFYTIEILNFSGRYLGLGITCPSLSSYVFGLHDRNGRSLMGKSIAKLSPMLSITLSQLFGKLQAWKSDFCNSTAPLWLLFSPFPPKKYLKTSWRKGMRVGSILRDFSCSNIPQAKASLESWIISSGMYNAGFSKALKYNTKYELFWRINENHTKFCTL